MNIAATYGRSLYAVAMGLFCGRWTLMSLGVVDYGLFGLIGGLTAFVMFFFNILSGSVGRFFALAIGKGLASESRESGLEECHRWFSLALMIHLLVPPALMLVFYPIGEWAVRCFLRIPPDRLGDCVWVFRVVCILRPKAAKLFRKMDTFMSIMPRRQSLMSLLPATLSTIRM